MSQHWVRNWSFKPENEPTGSQGRQELTETHSFGSPSDLKIKASSKAWKNSFSSWGFELLRNIHMILGYVWDAKAAETSIFHPASLQTSPKEVPLDDFLTEVMTVFSLHHLCHLCISMSYPYNF